MNGDDGAPVYMDTSSDGWEEEFLTVLAKIPRKVKLQMMIVMNQAHLKLTQKLRGIRKIGRSAAFSK